MKKESLTEFQRSILMCFRFDLDRPVPVPMVYSFSELSSLTKGLFDNIYLSNGLHYLEVKGYINIFKNSLGEYVYSLKPLTAEQPGLKIEVLDVEGPGWEDVSLEAVRLIRVLSRVVDGVSQVSMVCSIPKGEEAEFITLRSV